MKVQAQTLYNALKQLVPPRYIDYVSFDGVRAWTSSSDLEVEIRIGDSLFSPIALPRKPLLDLLEDMEGEEVELAQDEKEYRLFLRVGDFQGEIYGTSALKLHILENPTHEVLRGGEDFLQALLKGLSLGKTLLEVEEEKARVVATDGYRIHIYTLSVQGRVEKNYLIPIQVKGALKNLEGPVALHEAENMNALGRVKSYV